MDDLWESDAVAVPGFPWRGRQPLILGPNTYYSISEDFSETCMKMKEIGPRGEGASFV